MSTDSQKALPPISFEFFPPRTPEGMAKLKAQREQLYALSPEFCSVTYGAGGSTQDGSFAIVREVLAEGQVAAAHYSCVGATRERVREHLHQLKADGAQALVALGGDMPSGYGAAQGDFRYASELVEFVRAETADHFHIHVAGYPEIHPLAKTPTADLKALAHKVKCGANSVITQMFFNTDAYYRFVDDMDALGVHVPMIAGIMPITNSSGLLRFADKCGAEIPRWIRQRLEAFGDDSASIKAFGLDVVTDLCDQLRCGGVPGFHLYTMNQAEASLEICKRLRG
jgi:methylenetetrahydrofolate reductase (NADPH)